MLCDINAAAWLGIDGNEDKVWSDSHIILKKKDVKSALQGTHEQWVRFQSDGNKEGIYT